MKTLKKIFVLDLLCMRENTQIPHTVGCGIQSFKRMLNFSSWGVSLLKEGSQEIPDFRP